MTRTELFDVRARRAILAAALVGFFLSGCGEEAGPPGPDAGVSSVHVLFEPVVDPMPFGAVPWPDDLYLNGEGRVDMGTLPAEDADETYHAALRDAMHDLDGFSVVSPIYFRFDGEIDPSSLPADPSASTREDASIFLVDVDSASPSAFERVPVLVDWQDVMEPGQPLVRQLAMRPYDGHPLAEGRRYAAVVTRGLRAMDGSPIGPAPRFAALRDATTRPTEPLDAEAYDEYTPVLASLATNGVPKSDVVGLAVFRVQTISNGLEDARAVVRAGAPPVATLVEAVGAGPTLDARLGTPETDLPGLDVPGGVQHSHVGWMIHGTFQAPWFLAAEPFVHGAFTRDEAGALVVKRVETVPFTIWLPRSGDLSSLRLVLYQHGLSGERSSAMAIVDALNAAGYAVLAIDAPFHGLRARAMPLDWENVFTHAMEPDHFGDYRGGPVVFDFSGINDVRGELVAFHPFYLRDTLRQAASDLMMAVRVFDEGDLSALRAADPALASLGFADAPIAFVGESLGGVIGTLFVASEPSVGAALIVVSGGYLMHLLVESPPFNETYLPLLFPALGLPMDPSTLDYDGYHPTFIPQVAMWQLLLDRGDPIAYSTALRHASKHVLIQMARDDETLNNVASESLAKSIGAVMIAGAPQHTDLATGTAPVRGNFDSGMEMATRALYVFAPATHGMLSHRQGTSGYAHPVTAPFMSVAETPVMNPIDAVQAQMLHFFESWRSGMAEVAAPPLE